MNTKDITILLVDDEPDILEIVGYNLTAEGYGVITAENGIEAVKIAKKKKPQLIILDVMMPEMDGIEACEQIRVIPELKDAIITFLTARGEDYSQVAALDYGGDDYITKPILPKVLMSRIKALLRRRSTAASSADSNILIQLGDIEIDAERYTVKKKGVLVDMVKKEFELLSLLASKPGKVFTREEIFTKVWGFDVIVGNRTIDVHIRKIREKLGKNCIKTIKGIGYKLNF